MLGWAVRVVVKKRTKRVKDNRVFMGVDAFRLRKSSQMFIGI
jgi:hypothetical protein